MANIRTKCLLLHLFIWVSKVCLLMSFHTHWFCSHSRYTSFLASKKLFKCFICQIPVTMRITVWAMDHQRTRWLVLSLVMRKRSSRYCRRQPAYSSHCSGFNSNTSDMKQNCFGFLGFFNSPSGSFAPSGSVRLGPAAVGLVAAARWVCP